MLLQLFNIASGFHVNVGILKCVSVYDLLWIFSVAVFRHGLWSTVSVYSEDKIKESLLFGQSIMDVKVQSVFRALLTPPHCNIAQFRHPWYTDCFACTGPCFGLNCYTIPQIFRTTLTKKRISKLFVLFCVLYKFNILVSWTINRREHAIWKHLKMFWLVIDRMVDELFQ